MKKECLFLPFCAMPAIEDEVNAYICDHIVKTFAFMLLDNGSGTRSSDSGNPFLTIFIPLLRMHILTGFFDTVVRILKVSLKTARTCLG